MTQGFRGAEGLQSFENRTHCLPTAADDLKATARVGLAWLEGQLGERPFIAGEAMTVADLLLFSFIEFGALVGRGSIRSFAGCPAGTTAWPRAPAPPPRRSSASRPAPK